MRIWIVNPFDNLPVEGFRPQRYWLMARAFARAGHEVTLWCADFSHALKVCRDVEKLSKDFVESGESFSLRFVHEPTYDRNVCFRRILSHCVFAHNWLADASSLISSESSGSTLVIVSSPPLSLGVAARKLKARSSVNVIIDVMDAWPETFERIVPSWLLAPFRRMACVNYRSADAVSVVARRYLDLVRAYGTVSSCEIFHHGIELSATANLPQRSGCSRLVYVGNMSLSYDLSTVIDGVKLLDGVTLDIAGKGPDETSLRARAAGCGRIRFHGYIDSFAMSRLLVESDVGIVPMFPESCVGVPYKLADYAAAGLKIVNSLPGETAEMISRTNSGTFYRAGDVDSFVEAVRGLSAVGSSAALAKEFDAERIYGDYVRWAERVILRCGG